MGCECSAPIDKKDYLSQRKSFQDLARAERVGSIKSKGRTSYDSTNDDNSVTCNDRKCKHKKHHTCKSSESESTRKQFELSQQRLKQKSRCKIRSMQQLQRSRDVQESVVVSIYDGRERQEVETIMNNLQNLNY